ncbi:1-aminocyclopropane-1-carboxylate oxidase 1 [Acorus calamus]|uniref:1-aminocyclopropane-1-carboxylate oxidase 1 n=1 Tax=Acorus calamus TaxID=4465 RepID=A0AAV9E1I3_ACOCL|nr:1-aminocyclopropane-1-carboxylate oxidase 1 [Acorus calamus]
MGPETAPPPKLPCIDLSSNKLIPGTPLWDRTAAEVLHASAEFGFFEAVYPAIDASERRVMFARLAELFTLPLETKWRNTHDRPYHGFIGGLPRASVSTSPMMLRRVMEYKPPVPSPDTVISLKPHTDTNFITVLCENSGGLEVLVDDNGGSGAFAPLVATMPGSLFVFIGDAFMVAWSNGRLKSVPHRVVLREDKPRLSTGLFMVPEGGWMIEAPEELISDENPRRLYRPFEYFDILSRCYLNPMNMSGQQVFNELLRL